MSSDEKFDVIVIGGGITGLTAAHRLMQAKRKVLLIEPCELGGVLRTSMRDGFTCELGPAVFLLNAEIKTLIAELKLDQHISFSVIDRYQQYVWCEDRAQVVPKSIRAFIFTRLLSLSQRVKIISALFRSYRQQGQNTDQSVLQFFSTLFGSSVTRKIIDPALRGIYGGDIETLSARSIFSALWTHIQSGQSLFSYLKKRGEVKRRIFTLRGGNDLLVRKIHEEIRDTITLLQDRVVSVVDERLHNYFVVQGEEGVAYYADQVVVATSGKATARFISEVDRKLSERLNNLRCASLVVVHISTPRAQKLLPKSFGVLFPSVSEGPLLGFMFNSALFPHMAPGDKHLITACLGGIGKEHVMDLPDIEISKIVAAELKQKLNVDSFEILSIKRWKNAIPQYEVGHHTLIEELERVEREHPGLHFVGADRGGVGVPDRVRMGLL